jgi:hypothetical protein
MARQRCKLGVCRAEQEGSALRMRDRLRSRPQSSAVRRQAPLRSCHVSCQASRYDLTGFQNQISLSAPVTKVARPMQPLSSIQTVLSASAARRSTFKFQAARTAQVWKLPVPPAAFALRPLLVNSCQDDNQFRRGPFPLGLDLKLFNTL